MKEWPETKKRIMVALAAWAYEHYNQPIMTDAEFDILAQAIDVTQSTSRPDLDEWFREEFSPHTGVWVYNHPELDKLDTLLRQLHPQISRKDFRNARQTIA